MKKTVYLTLAMIMMALILQSQSMTHEASKSISKDNAITNKHSIGSSFFMMGNFLEDSPDYYLLTYGYQWTEKDRVFTEFNTWKYSEPLGSYGNSEEKYPGYIRSFGIGIGYQRFHWKGFFTTVQATPFLKYHHEDHVDATQKGFQLYLQFILGYRIELFNNRWYIEPAYALKYWPVDTAFPESYATIETGVKNYILEPSLNFGFKF